MPLPETNLPDATLAPPDWERECAAHTRWARRWTEPFRHRRRIQQVHPVHDFLFVYYPYSPAKLEQWHPGAGIRLQGAAQLAADRFPEPNYEVLGEDRICRAGAAPESTRRRWAWVAGLLRQTADNRANFSCCGLHEWAMVYRGRQVRHEETASLRLSQSEIDQVVEQLPIHCSHFDAFRFFAEEARPLNRLQPTLMNRAGQEQPACIHANMDLYKWATKGMPWLGSDLLRRCFELALDARAVDMRASPYDLSDFLDEPPIPIETEAGRAEYVRCQRAIAERAAPLRAELATALERLANAWATEV